MTEADSELVMTWAARNRPDSTRRAYLIDVDNLLEVVGGARALADVEPHHLVVFERHLRTRYAENTVRRKIGSVKSLFAYAVRAGALSRNPALRLKTPEKRPRSVPDEGTIAAGALRRALTEARGVAGALLRIAYATGARPAELAALRWGDVRAVGGRGHIRIGGRDVLVSAATYAALVRDRSSKSDAQLVCSGRGGAVASVRTIERAIAEAGVIYRLGKITPRMLRNSHEAHAIERGAPPDVVAATLGRASLPRRRATAKHPSSALYLPL